MVGSWLKLVIPADGVVGSSVDVLNGTVADKGRDGAVIERSPRDRADRLVGHVL